MSQRIVFYDYGSKSSDHIGIQRSGIVTGHYDEEKYQAPVQMNPETGYLIGAMYDSSAIFNKACESIKSMLFSHLNIYMGANRKNRTSQCYNEKIVHEILLPECNKMYDWILRYGFAPYIVYDISFRNGTRTSKTGKIKSENYGTRVFRVLDYEEGYVSVTRNKESGVLKLLWTWYSQYAPSYLEENKANGSLMDLEVSFVVNQYPTAKGEYTSPLSTCISSWRDLMTTKTMHHLAMRHKLNPMLVIEKQQDRASKNPSVIDELAATYSASFNNRTSSGLDGNDVRIPVGFGKSVRINTTLRDGTMDMGLEPEFDSSGYAVIRNDLGLVRDALEFNYYRTERSSLNDGGGGGPGLSNYGIRRMDFGAFTEEAYVTHLKGSVMTPRSENAAYVNPMSGVSYRVKKLEEGEKISEIKNDPLSIYGEPMSLSEAEYRLDVKLCSLTGYPYDLLINGASSPHGRSSTQWGKKETTGTTSSKKTLLQRLFSLRTFYENALKRIMEKCFKKNINKSKKKLLDELEESEWFVVNDVYQIHVELIVNPPLIDLHDCGELFGAGLMTVEEMITHARASQGLSLDVLKDTNFVKNATKKLKFAYDKEFITNKEMMSKTKTTLLAKPLPDDEQGRIPDIDNKNKKKNDTAVDSTKTARRRPLPSTVTTTTTTTPDTSKKRKRSEEGSKKYKKKKKTIDPADSKG